jgi:carbonic anhydrase
MSIVDFVKGNKNFLKVKFKENEKIYNKLIKEGQSPKALFIGCSDSRVLPETIVAANPGDLFIVRNIGNFVPPYKPDNDFHATAAAIEYAVNVLNVEHIIVCGHSHCGACAALYQNLDDKPELMHVKKWLELGQKAKEQAIKIDGGSAPTTERVSLIFQSKNLLTYPFIKEKIEANKLFLHAWYYRLEDGVIEFYDEEKREFLILNEENI